MSSRYRSLWSKLSRLSIHLKYVPSTKARVTQRRPYARPLIISFSIFTWLGFDQKLTAEDELIETIKHCVLFIQRSQYEKAEQLLHVALRQAQQIHHNTGITYIYDVMANLALERAQLKKAKQLFVSVTQRIMADGATEEDLRVIHLSAKLARISHLEKDYTTAQLGYEWCLEKMRQAVEMEHADDNIKLMAMTEDWYGRLFVECNKYAQGLKLMVDSLNHMKEVTDIDKEHIVIQLNDIGTVCDLLGQIDEGIQYFQEAIEIGKSLKMEELGAMYVNLGQLYLKKNLIDLARKNCGHAWKLGVTSKNDDIKNEAESCLKQIKSLS